MGVESRDRGEIGGCGEWSARGRDEAEGDSGEYYVQVDERWRRGLVVRVRHSHFDTDYLCNDKNERWDGSQKVGSTGNVEGRLRGVGTNPGGAGMS